MTSDAVVGIDVGGTKLLAVRLDGDAVVDEARVPTPRGAAAMVDGLAEAAARLAPDGATAVGVGIAGLVDRDGVFRVGANLADLHDVPLRDTLVTRLRTRVAVDNDATCAAWAEHELGAARGCAEAVFVTLGTGIGGGLVAGGRLQRGANGFAGEPGHMVVDPNGPRCPCGNRGCWERFASGSGLGRLGREAAEAGRSPRLLELVGGDAEAVRGEHVVAAVRDGDAGAVDVWRSFAWWVALGVANLVNILDPEIVVLGGGLAEVGELLAEPVREHYEKLAGYDRAPRVRIVTAELGEHAGAVGAALLARQAL